MRRLERLGLRARLALALAAVAVVSVLLATLLANNGLDSRLNDFAHERLQSSARHSAELAAGYYARDGGWSRRGAGDLAHLAQMNGYRLAIRDRSGRPVIGAAAVPAAGERAQAPVRSGSEVVGTVIVAPAGGVLTAEDRDLHRRLNRQHLVAAGLAVALGLLAAVLIAAPLARPIRRLTDVAGRMEQGELQVRVALGGAPELDKLGHAFNRLAETLQREDEIRRDAAADIAHELRTPLTGVISRIEAAQDGVLADERQNLDAIHSEALRLAQLVEDLERLAEAERPGLFLERQRVDLADLVGRRVAAYDKAFRDKGVALVADLSPATTWGDPGRLDQIVDNLLSNALRYTDEGGRVTVTTSATTDAVVVGVADTGIGIAAEDLHHVFERFWRSEKSRSRATGGSGIGLAVVRELVRAHDGRVDVDSEPGRGTRFRVTLPGPLRVR